MKTNKISYKRIVILLVSLLIVPLGTYVSTKIEVVPDYEIKNDVFTEEKLIDYLKLIRIKFPHIVLAQARLESNNYSSFIFKNNNNMFGMKHPIVRITTSLGKKVGYASYNSWRESVLDYALYSSKFIPDISSENDYYDFLKKYYAEDPNYITKLKIIIENERLKDLF